MSWLSSWFKSGPEAAGKVLETGMKGIDMIFYTKEEKAIAQQKLADTWLALQDKLGQETTVRSVTRRVMAILVMAPYVGLILGAAAAYPFHVEYAGFLLDLADGKFGWLVVAVGGFYFGPHMIGRTLSNKQQ